MLSILFAPSLWVSYVLRKYNRNPETNFPGTGGELARHLLDRFDLHDVKVVVTESGDHYSPIDRSVALTQDRYDGKTLTAIVIAAHECGHAIQHARREPFFLLRHRLAQSAQGAQIIGSALLAASPLIGGLAVSPHLEPPITRRCLYGPRLRSCGAASYVTSRIRCKLQKGTPIAEHRLSFRAPVSSLKNYSEGSSSDLCGGHTASVTELLALDHGSKAMTEDLNSIKLYTAADIIEAQILQKLLASEGITTTLKNENLQTGVGELPFVEMWPELWVIAPPRSGSSKTTVE